MLISNTINTNALYKIALNGAIPEFSFSKNGVDGWQTEPISYINIGEYSIWYKISAPNYNDFIKEAKLRIVPSELVAKIM